MKHTSAFKNTTRSILIASVMFGVTGMVYAQSSTAKKQGSSISNPATHTYGKDSARDYAISQGSGSHAYGKDQSADYAKSQGSGLHTYGKDASSDYSRSQGSDLPDELPVWVRVLHKAQAPLVPLRAREGTNEVYFLIEQLRRHGRESGVPTLFDGNIGFFRPCSGANARCGTVFIETDAEEVSS